MSKMPSELETIRSRLQSFWCSRSIRKVLPIESVNTPPNYQKLRCQRRSKRLSWMNYIPLLARKKRNLRSDNRGSGYSLRFELGCGAGKNLRNSASLFGACSSSQTLLQWCFSCLWHLVLRCSIWNANWQTGTYSVEAVNADLRHYLKRLARKSRCFSRRMQSLAKNIQLFVYCYNHRQLAKRTFPK